MGDADRTNDRIDTTDSAETVDTQVLVVGAGPAGLVAGITLARYGIRVLVIEKRGVGSTLSRALVISTRGMELLRAWGLEDAVRAGAADVVPRGWVTEQLASSEGREVPLGYPTAAEAAKISPTQPAWVPQDHVEPLLLALLRTLPSAEVRFHTELVSLEQDHAGVHAVVRDPTNGATQAVDARFVVGADGAHSTLRAHLGVRMEGPDDLAEFHRVEFEAPLAVIAGEHRYGLYLITHPDAEGTLAPRGRGDRWGFSREWRPGQPRFSDASEEQLIALLATAVGVADVRPRIERISAFSFAAQIAERYRTGRGFLVGDAAHRMTPRGGTGMNTAIQDAFDLGWKLAWVLRGWTGLDLLDSYEAERRPVGLHNVGRASQADGAQRVPDEALPWDLNGRLAHHWLQQGNGTVSTLDLLGDGLTLLCGPSEPRWAEWAQARTSQPSRAPLTMHTLDTATARALDLAPGGALLLRPDGHPLRMWPSFTPPADTISLVSGSA